MCLHDHCFKFLLVVLVPILQDYTVNNFSANDTPPRKKLSLFALDFFVNHGTIAPVTFHNDLPASSAVVYFIFPRIRFRAHSLLNKD